MSDLYSAFTHTNLQHNNIYNSQYYINDNIFINAENLICYDMSLDEKIKMLLQRDYVRKLWMRNGKF